MQRKHIDFSFQIFLKPIIALIALMGSANHAVSDEATQHELKDVMRVASFTSMDNEPVHLSDYQGKAVLLVNTASECGFTRQYEDLQTVYETYQDRGLVVIAVPSNDFGGQEPRSNEDIKHFCETNYNVTFPIMQKVSVTGNNAHPFYAKLQQIMPFSSTPKWNFHKYLINPNGELVDWFSSVTNPKSERVMKAIEAVLPAQNVQLSSD